MGTYIVRGGRRIEGEFAVRGSKNGTLPILAACILAEDEVVLENIPLIQDVKQTLEILQELGCRVERTGRTVVIDSRHLFEDHRVMREDAVKAFLDRLGDHALRYIQRTQNALDLLCAVTAQHQPIIVPRTGKRGRIKTVKICI